MEPEKFFFTLSKELEYSKNGEFMKTLSIEFSPPTMDEFDEAGSFDQKVMGALLDANKFADTAAAQVQAQEQKFSAPNKDEIKMLLMASSSVPLSEIGNAFKALACKVGVLDEDGTMLKNDHFKKMTRSDFIDMLCEYAVNFTFPSLFSEGGQ